MIRFQPRLAPTMFTIPAVAVLVALGVWQLQRLEWKGRLIAERAAAVAAAPVAPPRTLAEARSLEFHPVVAEGVFLHDKEIYLNAIGGKGGAGFDVLTPLRETDGRIVFVNRGFVPTERKDPATRPAGRLAGGRDHAAHAAQRPSAIRDHLVFARRRPGGDLCRLPQSRRRLGMSAYQDLEARFRRLGAVEGAIGVLHWDTAAMMPAGGGKARAEQTATLRGIAHAMLTAPEIGDLLAAAEIDTAALGPWQHANLREMRRRWRHAA